MEQGSAVTNPDHSERNYRLGVINGVIYFSAETLLDPTLVLVTFLSTLTQSPLLLGLLLPIRDGSWSIPQFWVSTYMQNQPDKIKIYRQMSVVRIIAWATLALVVNFVRDPDLLLVLFFLTYSVSMLMNGLAGLPFLEVVGKTIPPARRGEFFALRLALGGLGGILASVLVRWVLDPHGPLVYPYNYGLLSALFFLLATISLLAFNQVRETPDQLVQPRNSFSAQLQRALRIAKEDLLYRRYLILQSSLVLAAAATPFFAVYGRQRLGINPEMVGVYLAVYTTANLLTNLYLGRISRRIGYPKIMFLATFAGLLMSSLMLVLSLVEDLSVISPAFASAWLIPVFFLSGLRGSSIGISGNSMLLDIAPENDRSIYLGFTNTIIGLVLLSTGISGVLINVFGFQFLFCAAVLAHLFAFWTGIQLVRKKKTIVES